MIISDRFWTRLSYLIGLMAIGIFFGLAVFSASVEVKDLDLWLHLGMGRYISFNGYVPSHDVLSCAIAGKPWVNHEWLFQVLVYLVHHFFGFDGLITMQTVVVALTFLILLVIVYRRNAQCLSLFMMLLVLLVYQTRFTIRPDIFSLLFFAFFMYIYVHHLHRRWALYALVAVQVLWVNMHGFFFFGPLIVWMALGGEWLKRTVPLPWFWKESGRLTDKAYQRLMITAIAVPLACLLNPLTVKGAIYPLGVIFQLGGESKIFFKHIYELQKPITAATIWTSNYAYYKILILLSAYSFFLNRRRIDLTLFCLWLILLMFSLAAIRNMIFFSFGAYAVFMVNVTQVTLKDIFPFQFSNDKFKSITGILAKLGLMLWMVNFGLSISANGYFNFDTYERKSEFWGVSKRSYPYKAADFLVRNNIKGNFFNDFNSGAYLVGRAHPNIKVFIDGRTEEYGATFFEQYQKIWKEGNAKIFQDLSRRYNITAAFLNSTNQEIPPKVAQMFYSFKDWSVVYFDDDALIFLKQTPANKPLISRFAIDLNKWEAKPMDLMRLGSKRIDPFVFTNRAYTLNALGILEPAKREAYQALKIAPDWIPSYKLLGKIYGQQKNHRRAFEYLRIAAMYSPNDTDVRFNLALAYEHLRDYKGAIAQYQRLIESAPDDPKGYFGIAKAYSLNSDDAKSLAALKKARQLVPKDKIDVKKIHDIISKHNLSNELKKQLEEATR